MVDNKGGTSNTETRGREPYYLEWLFLLKHNLVLVIMIIFSSIIIVTDSYEQSG
jgi:hypothetical protein